MKSIVTDFQLRDRNGISRHRNRVSPTGTFENSPAIHCRGTELQKCHRFVIPVVIPAINCRAIFRCPYGTISFPNPGLGTHLQAKPRLCETWGFSRKGVTKLGLRNERKKVF